MQRHNRDTTNNVARMRRRVALYTSTAGIAYSPARPARGGTRQQRAREAERGTGDERGQSCCQLLCERCRGMVAIWHVPRKHGAEEHGADERGVGDDKERGNEEYESRQ